MRAIRCFKTKATANTTAKQKGKAIDDAIEQVLGMSPTELAEKINGRYLWGAGISIHIDNFLFFDSSKLGFNYVFALKDTNILWAVDF